MNSLQIEMSVFEKAGSWFGSKSGSHRWFWPRGIWLVLEPCLVSTSRGSPGVGDILQSTGPPPPQTSTLPRAETLGSSHPTGGGRQPFGDVMAQVAPPPIACQGRFWSPGVSLLTVMPGHETENWARSVPDVQGRGGPYSQGKVWTGPTWTPCPIQEMAHHDPVTPLGSRSLGGRPSVSSVLLTQQVPDSPTGAQLAEWRWALSR